jgi:hypothetical protein
MPQTALWTASPAALPGFRESSIKRTVVYNQLIRTVIVGGAVIRLVTGERRAWYRWRAAVRFSET